MEESLLACCSIGSERLRRFLVHLQRTIDIESIDSTPNEWKSESSWRSDLISDATHQSTRRRQPSTSHFTWNSCITHFDFLVRFFHCREERFDLFFVSGGVPQRIESSRRDLSTSRSISIQAFNHYVENNESPSEISSTIDPIEQSIVSTRHRTTSSSRHDWFDVFYLECCLSTMFDLAWDSSFVRRKDFARRSSSISNESSHRKTSSFSFVLCSFLLGSEWTFTGTNTCSSRRSTDWRWWKTRIGQTSVERNNTSLRSVEEYFENSFESRTSLSSEHFNVVPSIRNSEKRLVVRQTDSNGGRSTSSFSKSISSNWKCWSRSILFISCGSSSSSIVSTARTFFSLVHFRIIGSLWAFVSIRNESFSSDFVDFTRFSRRKNFFDDKQRTTDWNHHSSRSVVQNSTDVFDPYWMSSTEH